MSTSRGRTGRQQQQLPVAWLTFVRHITNYRRNIRPDPHTHTHAHTTDGVHSNARTFCVRAAHTPSSKPFIIIEACVFGEAHTHTHALADMCVL